MVFVMLIFLGDIHASVYKLMCDPRINDVTHRPITTEKAAGKLCTGEMRRPPRERAVGFVRLVLWALARVQLQQCQIVENL